MARIFLGRPLEIDVNFHSIWFVMELAQLGAGLPEEAVASTKRGLELAPWDPIGRCQLAAAHYQAGDRERSQEWVLGSSHNPIAGAMYYAPPARWMRCSTRSKRGYQHVAHVFGVPRDPL